MQPIHPLVQKLLDIETLKTWSVIVTLFGDFEGDHLTGNQIKDTLGPLGIKPQAIRVALHRLKADGWITAEKQGREAIYRLAPKGRLETDTAAKDVYRQDIKFSNGWQFYLFQHEMENTFAIPITKELLAAPVEVSNDLDMGYSLAPVRRNIPVWIEERLVPQHLLQNARAILAVLETVSTTDLDLPESDAVCLRLLVLHQWRRLALRHGTWAHISLLPDGPLATCHTAVTAFLRRK